MILTRRHEHHEHQEHNDASFVYAAPLDVARCSWADVYTHGAPIEEETEQSLLKQLLCCGQGHQCLMS